MLGTPLLTCAGSTKIGKEKVQLESRAHSKQWWHWESTGWYSPGALALGATEKNFPNLNLRTSSVHVYCL